MGKIIDKIKLEIKCFIADQNDPNKFSPNCFGRKKPSFYIRYTPEKQAEILKREREEILKTLESLYD